MRSDKDKIEVILTALQLGRVDFDYTVNFILDAYKSSRRFNFHNFWWGAQVGIIITLIIKAIIK